MFIQTETTPNPATLKFLPGRDVLPEASVNFIAAADAEASPLASRLFTVPGVEGVFLGADFVTVTKAGTRDRSEEHTSELQSLMRISYAVFCLKKNKNKTHNDT